MLVTLETLRPMYELTYKENKSPVVQILVLVDDEAGEGGCEEAHNVCEPIGDSQQSPGVVGRHVDVSAHKTWAGQRSNTCVHCTE